jgi:hypothetical protein
MQRCSYYNNAFSESHEKVRPLSLNPLALAMGRFSNMSVSNKPTMEDFLKINSIKDPFIDVAYVGRRNFRLDSSMFGLYTHGNIAEDFWERWKKYKEINKK